MSELLQKIWTLFQNIIKKVKNTSKLTKLLSFLSLIILFWYKKIRHRKHDNIPTLPGWTRHRGHIPFFKKYFENDINEHLYELIKSASFPPISSMNVWSYHGVLVIDPDLVKFIWRTEFEKFQKGPRLRQEFQELLGDGIFMSDPPRWQFHRKSAARMFSKRNLKEYMFKCNVIHTKNVINKINSNTEFLDNIDMYNMLARFTLDCFTAIAFGKATDSVSMFPNEHPFAFAFDNCMYLFAVRHMTLPLIWKTVRRLPECLTFGKEYQIKRDIKIIDDFADKILNSRQSEISNISDEFGDKYNDLLSLFMKYDSNLTKTQLKYIAMNMIIAGRDTTRLLLSWFFYEMCLEINNEIKLKIYAEIDDFSSKNGEKMNYKQANNNFKYLESSLLECLRLHPAVPFLARYAMQDVILPNGNVIRKGNEVVIPTFTFGRNPNVYKDPLKFDSDRFYNKGKEPINVKTVYEYPFFNTNPRLCLGRSLALMESKVFLFHFFREYNFEMADKNQQIKVQTGVVLNMVDGIRLKLTKR